MSTSPIRPDEVSSRRSSLPDGVFDVFNQLIVDHFDGVIARFTQDAAVKRLVDQLSVSRRTIFDRCYLDIEPAYREAGWTVLYDKPAYNETYEPTFTFSRSDKKDRTDA
jgi:hypothetical protein